MTAAHPREPYIRDHETSLTRRMEKGATMPRSLEGLLAWYIGAVAEELPERLHKGELWHDQVSAHERDSGTRPQGGSVLGAPAWSGGMRQRLEGSPSQADEDGYYRFPVSAALSRMTRREAWMANDLRELARREGDWRAMAAACLCHPERFKTYITEALRCLWHGYHEQERRVA